MKINPEEKPKRILNTSPLSEEDLSKINFDYFQVTSGNLTDVVGIAKLRKEATFIIIGYKGYPIFILSTHSDTPLMDDFLQACYDIRIFDELSNRNYELSYYPIGKMIQAITAKIGDYLAQYAKIIDGINLNEFIEKQVKDIERLITLKQIPNFILHKALFIENKIRTEGWLDGAWSKTDVFPKIVIKKESDKSEPIKIIEAKSNLFEDMLLPPDYFMENENVRLY